MNNVPMNSKLEFLSRRNQGKHLMTEYIHSLSKIMDIDSEVLFNNVLDLGETDTVYNQFISNIKAIGNGSYTNQFTRFSLGKSPESIAEIENTAKSIMKPAKFYLLTKLSHFCGAVKINSEVIVNNISELVYYDGDSCNLVSPELTTGLMIDFHTETSGEEFYDFIAYYP